MSETPSYNQPSHAIEARNRHPWELLSSVQKTVSRTGLPLNVNLYKIVFCWEEKIQTVPTGCHAFKQLITPMAQAIVMISGAVSI